MKRYICMDPLCCSFSMAEYFKIPPLTVWNQVSTQVSYALSPASGDKVALKKDKTRGWGQQDSVHGNQLPHPCLFGQHTSAWTVGAKLRPSRWPCDLSSACSCYNVTWSVLYMMAQVCQYLTSGLPVPPQLPTGPPFLSNRTT